MAASHITLQEKRKSVVVMLLDPAIRPDLHKDEY